MSESDKTDRNKGKSKSKNKKKSGCSWALRVFLLAVALSALLTMGLLTACGGKTTDKTVDLTAFYNTLAEEYGWAEDAASSGEEDIKMMN